MPDRPNILIIHADQHRYDCLGSYANGDVLTPNIDTLAADGVRHQVRGGVAQNVQGLLVPRLQERHVAVAHDRAPEVHQLAVHLPGDEAAVGGQTLYLGDGA